MYALKLELKLNNKERSRLAGCAGFSRFVYNFGLNLLTQSWEFKDIKATDSKRLAAIEKVFTNYVKTNPSYSWIKEYPSAIYSQALRNLTLAVDRWRRGLSGFPKFKSRKYGDSFTVLKKAGIYPAKGEKMLPFTNRQVLYPSKRINIPGLGEFRLKRPIPFLCSSQAFTVSRTADRWFVSFTLDVDKIPPIYHESESVGIDLGVKCFATLSDGSNIHAPLSVKQAKTANRAGGYLQLASGGSAKLSKKQWRNRKKQIGNQKLGVQSSKNAKMYLVKLARNHAQIANIRKDFLQKITTKISRKYYRIRIEDLNVVGMIANSKLSEAISSLGLYEFRRMLTYKASFYGTKVELVDRWYSSSKTCSCCGHIQPISLAERVFRCEKCNHVQDRDWNAAINLKNAPDSKVRLAESELNACGQEGAVSLGRSRKQTSKRRVS